MTRWEDYNFQAMRADEAMRSVEQGSPQWLKFKRMKKDAERIRDSIPKEVGK